MVAHGDDAVLPAPRFRRPVDIDFDPVALRVVQIDRLADRMVRPPGEADAVRRHMRQPTPPVPAARQQKADLEPPRPVLSFAPRARPTDQPQACDPSGAQGPARRAPPDPAQPPRPPIARGTAPPP